MSASVASRFKNILGLETKSGTSAPEAWLQDMFGGNQSASGISVTPRSAMACAPVRAAVAAISEPIGTLPLIVYKRDADGSKERATDHPIYSLLHDHVNDWTSASTFREQLTRDALLYPHGGIAHIVRNSEGKPINLFRLDQERTDIKVIVDPFEGPKYTITESGKSRDVAAADILQIPSPALSELGLVHEARDTIGLAMTLERHASKLFAKGGQPSGILTLKGAVGPEALARARAPALDVTASAAQKGTRVDPRGKIIGSESRKSENSEFLAGTFSKSTAEGV